MKTARRLLFTIKEPLRRLLRVIEADPEPDPPKPMLIVMRLNEMRVHSGQTEGVCARCRQAVGIFSSGQDMIRRHGADHFEVVCLHCQPISESAPVKQASA